MTKLLKNTKAQLLIIILLTSLAYLNIFQNQFALDDKTFIVDWEVKNNLFNIPKFFQGAVPQGHEGVYRPVRSIFYALSYKLWGINTPWYHLQALIVHLLNTVLVYFIVLKIIENSKVKSQNAKLQLKTQKFPQRTLPFITALLFGLHPIHTESIAYITASFDNFGILFFFLSFYLYLVPARPRLARLASLIFALLAFLSNEIALTLPLVIVLYELIIKKKSTIKDGLFIFKKVWPYFAGVLVYFFLRLSLTHNLHRGEYIGESIYYTILIMLKAFLEYLKLLILPLNLSLVHILPGRIPTLGVADIKKELLESQHLFDPWIAISITIIIIFITAIIFFWKRTPLVSFSLAWFLITLLPVSHIIPLQAVMAERYLYIPSFGFVLLLTCVILSPAVAGRRILWRSFPFTSFRVRMTSDGLRMTILLVLALFYGIVTFQRNTDWKDDLTIWQKATRVSPQSVSAHYNLGNIYQSQNNLDQALIEFDRALKIDPEYHPALSNLGFVYLSLDQLDEARQTFQKAIQIKDFFPMHYGLALIYLKENQKKRASNELIQALKLKPDFVQARELLEGIKD